jgi:hypothetical protein
MFEDSGKTAAAVAKRSLSGIVQPRVEQTNSEPLGEDSVAKVEGENADFEALKPLGEDLSEADLFSQPVADEDQAAASAGGEFLEAEPRPDESGKTAAEEEGQAEEPAKQKGSFLEVLTHASPYTVMLGVALAAILTAVACLLLELNSYNFDVGASDYQQRAE